MSNEYRRQVPDGTFHHRMSRTVNGMTFGFEWHGGAYISVCRGQAFASPSEVINVWSDSADGPLIPRTVEAMAAEVDEWIDSYGRANLVHDARENW